MIDPREFLKAECHARHLRAQLWTLLTGVLIALLLRYIAPPLWLYAFGVAVVASLLVRFFYRPDIDALAVKLDAQLNSKNRMEAVDLLAGDPSALARAQREETARTLGQQIRPPVTPWILLTGTLLMFLLGGGFGASDLLSRPPSVLPPLVPKPAAKTEASAVFRWKSPEAETLCSKLEEVPLQAEAESNTGLKEVTLELSVNGETRKSIHLEEIVQSALLKAGKQALELSISLDEMNLEPFDVVSYHLRGQRVSDHPLPVTASPIQFIQIRPMREDVKIINGEGQGNPCYALLSALKVAQLQALEQNFLLTHAEISKTSPVWIEENTRVGEDQKVVADKAHAAIAFLIENHAPVQVVDLVTRAEPFRRTASVAIAATQNEKAVPDQGHALALITEAQKHFMKMMVLGGSPSSDQKKPAPPDPFKDKQKLALPKREETAAGKLEKLAEKQSSLVDKLKQPGSDPAKQAQAEREVQGQAQALSGQLDAGIDPELAQAAEAAQAAAGQLDAKDPDAAREPATKAAERLHAALAKVLAQGQKAGLAAMDEAQRELNRAAEDLKREGAGKPEASAIAKQRTEATAQQLDKEAQHQQEQGSAPIAAQLHKLAEELRGLDLAKLAASTPPPVPSASPGSEPTPGTPPNSENPAVAKLDELAQKLAEAQARMTPGRELLERSLQDLQRAKANLEHMANGKQGSDKQANDPQGREELRAEMLDTVKATAQRSDAALANPAAQKSVRRLKESVDVNKGPMPGDMTVETSMVEPTEALIGFISAALAEQERDQTITTGRLDDVPPAYREAVSKYFEQLSRSKAK